MLNKTAYTTKDYYTGETNMTNKTLMAQLLKDLAKDKFFTVEFIKKDGSIRKMNARLGVKKHLKGGKSTTDHVPHLLTVFDTQKQAYRSINTDTLLSISVDGKKYSL